uniref:Zinc finger protein ZFPM2-like n=1 Tax=Sinocyclocheilus grahami TaxID=75366 RepID=A0A672S381_SINGR
MWIFILNSTNIRNSKKNFDSPLDGGLEEEEEECISDANELSTKEVFSVEENFPADFEPDNLTCEDMEYFCGKGEENGNRETGETEMETDSEKTRHPPLEPEEWDGPRELDLFNKDGERRIHSRQQLPVGTTWGPFEGKIELNTNAQRQRLPGPQMTRAEIIHARLDLQVNLTFPPSPLHHCMSQTGKQIWRESDKRPPLCD